MTTAIRPTPVLSDLLPAARYRTAALVVGGALVTALASQVRIPLGFTPVPINLGTFSVVLVGGALGARRGAASMGLYLALGVLGLPFFAGASSGWSYFTGATAGYLVCYPLVAAMVGYAAEHGRDRHVLSFSAAVVAANLILYTVGALWLGHVLGVPVFGLDGSAWSMGVQPFVVGDLLKMVAAGLLFPAAWRIISE